MKAAVAFLVVFLALVADAANKKHKTKNMRHDYEDIADSEDDGGGEWPQPEAVRSFGVPDVFTASPLTDVNNEATTTSGKHHGKHRKLTTHHQ